MASFNFSDPFRLPDPRLPPITEQDLYACFGKIEQFDGNVTVCQELCDRYHWCRVRASQPGLHAKILSDCAKLLDDQWPRLDPEPLD